MTEPALKTVDGRIVTIDTGIRMFTFRPDKEFAIDVYWSPNQDGKVGKFKNGWKAKVTYETDKQGKRWLTELVSTYTPGDKPQQSQQDKILIAKEVAIKALVDLRIETFNPEKDTYDSCCEDIMRNFEMIMPRFLKAGGGE